MSEKVKIEISKEVYEKAVKLAEEAGFPSVEALIEFLIEEASESTEGEEISKEDEEKIKERLRDLGYI
ncbi:MAG: CopG family transcriptional regulator [Desulfurococcales archaeon]|nr:CopG family transcriptional regulator [Desulfurococcales archaeon]